MIREKKLIELYVFAIKYAKSFRSSFVEVDDLAHEMMLAVLKARWRDDAYATRVMRNRFYDLARRGKLERGCSVPFDSPEVQNMTTLDEAEWNVNITLERLLCSMPALQAQILKHVLQGRSNREIQRRERVSAKTVYRCVNKTRELLAV